jgi:hypothetical protein
METFVAINPAPGARLTRWQRLLLWLLTRNHNIAAMRINHNNGQTTWVWMRINVNHYAPRRHLERCLHKSP